MKKIFGFILIKVAEIFAIVFGLGCTPKSDLIRYLHWSILNTAVYGGYLTEELTKDQYELWKEYPKLFLSKYASEHKKVELL